MGLLSFSWMGIIIVTQTEKPLIRVFKYVDKNLEQLNVNCAHSSYIFENLLPSQRVEIEQLILRSWFPHPKTLSTFGILQQENPTP